MSLLPTFKNWLQLTGKRNQITPQKLILKVVLFRPSWLSWPLFLLTIAFLSCLLALYNPCHVVISILLLLKLTSVTSTCASKLTPSCIYSINFLWVEHENRISGFSWLICTGALNLSKWHHWLKLRGPIFSLSLQVFVIVICFPFLTIPHCIGIQSNTFRFQFIQGFRDFCQVI